MKILMINVVCGIKSTGRICTDIAKKLEEQGHEVKIAYGRERIPKSAAKNAIKISTNFDVKMHGIKARIFDSAGFESKRKTKKFINWINEFNPDIIHIHNTHGYYINNKLLFIYLIKLNKKVIWTFHDCWAFTGHCCYFDYNGCNKWKELCHNCPQKKEYPKSFIFDSSKKNFILKKELFPKLQDLTIVVPSIWLYKIVSESFFKNNKIIVINNGIDTNKFTYRENKIKEKYNIINKKIILGVASVWSKRKGLDDFIELSKKIDNTYIIILVGLNKNEINKLPLNIIGIEKTDSPEELAELYSAADVFFNPTYEDNYPTTNLEAIACNTPVITYNTGGSIESAKLFGYIVKKGDIASVIEKIKLLNKLKPLNNKKDISIENMVDKYLKLYLE